MQCVTFRQCASGSAAACSSPLLERSDDGVTWQTVAAWASPSLPASLSLTGSALAPAQGAPAVQAWTPPATGCGACGAAGVGATQRVDVRFSRPVYPGGGSVLFERGSLGQLRVPAVNGQWFAVDGSTLQITPQKPLGPAASCSRITLEGFAFVDANGSAPGSVQGYEVCIAGNGSSGAPPAAGSESPSSSSGLSAGAAVGIAVSMAVLLCCCVGLGLFLLLRAGRRSKGPDKASVAPDAETGDAGRRAAAPEDAPTVLGKGAGDQQTAGAADAGGGEAGHGDEAKATAEGDEPEDWSDSGSASSGESEEPHTEPGPPELPGQPKPCPEADVDRVKESLLDELRATQMEALPARKKRFRRLCLRWHPDKNPDAHDLATEVFKFLQQQRSPYLREGR